MYRYSAEENVFILASDKLYRSTQVNYARESVLLINLSTRQYIRVKKFDKISQFVCAFGKEWRKI